MDSQTTYCWADDRTPNINKNKGSCPAGQCCGVGNPIMPAIGNKYQIETDYRSAGAASLTLRRYYNSIGTSPLSSLGVNWRHEYDRSIGIGTAQGQTAAAALDASSSYVFPAPVRQDPNASTSGIAVPMTPSVAVSRADGKVLYFSLLNGKWTADADVADQLVQLTDSTGKITGWQYTASPNDEVETYDANGRLLSITNRAGLTQTLAYDQQGRLNSVTDGFGHALVFAYGASGRLTTVTDPAGGAYQFEYDGPSGNCTSTVCNNLTAVTYPNGSKRIYWYNESSFTGSRNLAHALTGITDENGARFATYTYDVNGNAISTEHAGGIEKYSVAYPQQYAQSTVTDPLGTTRAYNFQTVQGVVRHSGLSQPGGSGCNAASTGITYDANGNVATRTDFNGNVTAYTYDQSRNLETRRVEASGTAAARTIATEWHGTYRLPTRIAEPNKLTTYTYDAQGNLLGKTEQATSDATGSQGLAAAATGTARTWSHTYNSVGLVLSATDPLGNTTSYSYDSQGNLTAITNAAGQVTSLSNYDANGHVGRITDANGVNTDLAYSPRGWLTAKTTGGETTRYAYDGVGQLTRVTLPDGAAINYTYDDAHRLTDVADSMGNNIHYTLDAMGNRIAEQARDASGALARQVTRVYDALNRLQQITGGVQ